MSQSQIPQMPTTLFDSFTRQQLFDRIDRLTPDRQPLWGTLTSPRMLCHVSDQLRNALSELEAHSVPGPGPWPAHR